MLKKIFLLAITVVLVIGMCGSVNAEELKTKIDIIQQASETKYLENDQGYVSKTIVDSNSETGEVTIELKLSNIAKEVEEITETEVIFVIDNSPSMDFVTESGLTRKEIVIPAAKKLAEKLLGSSSNLKIGIVKFNGGNTVLSASSLMCSLTNDKAKVLDTLDTLNSQSTEGGTNKLAGVTRANNSFSANCQNKIIVLLTDGVPNYDLDYNSAMNDTTTSEALEVQKNTKTGLINISNSGTYIISMMTGMSESDGNTDKEGTVYEGSTIEEDLQAVERIFGTQENPTVGKFYLVASANVDNIISNDILNDVVEKVQRPINKVKIVDYFPEDITENFEFSYVGEPSLGTVTGGIDEETKTISWNIDTLKGDEVATLRYKLKIKDMKNTELLNKTIATNEKVVLTYEDTEQKEYTVTLTSSPKIQLSEVKEPEQPVETPEDDGKDDTTIKEDIPQTGENIAIILGLAVMAISLLIIVVKYRKYKEIK